MQRRILKSLKAVFDVGVGFTSQALMIQIQVFNSKYSHLKIFTSRVIYQVFTSQSQVLKSKNSHLKYWLLKMVIQTQLTSKKLS